MTAHARALVLRDRVACVLSSKFQFPLVLSYFIYDFQYVKKNRKYIILQKIDTRARAANNTIWKFLEQLKAARRGESFCTVLTTFLHKHRKEAAVVVTQGKGSGEGMGAEPFRDPYSISLFYFQIGCLIISQ